MTKNNNVHIVDEAMHSWVQKDNLLKSVNVGFSGPPELRKDEKRHFLGEFKEIVIKALTKEQVGEKEVYPEIKKALEHEKANRLIINGELSSVQYHKYEELAKEFNIKTTINHDPDLLGDVGLIVVSDEAVDEHPIFIDRKLTADK